MILNRMVLKYFSKSQNKINYPGIHQYNPDLPEPKYQVTGVYKGVESRISNSTNAKLIFDNGFYTGRYFDNLEFIRRFCQKALKMNFYNVNSVKDLWELKIIENLSNGNLQQVNSYKNHSPTPPKLDDFLIWLSDGTWKVGVISEISSNSVRVVSQSANFSQSFDLINQEKTYSLACPSSQVVGWVRVSETQIDLKQVQRVKFKARTVEGMFDLNDPFELSFSKDPDHFAVYKETLHYYSWTSNYYHKINTATTELHHMVTKATERVIQSDDLLRKFEINEVFFKSIRESWNRSQQFLIGRFDLGFDGKNLKLIEYNSDSPGISPETGIIQGLWARTTGCDVGTDPGADFHRNIVSAWTRLGKGRKVHIFVDYAEDEEKYIEKYYARVLKEAGVFCKEMNIIEDIEVSEAGVFDKDGERISLIWKVWNWNTVMSRYFSGDSKLSKVMFHETVDVIEPFWKVISSNKALLPVLCDMYPGHPYLLRSYFEHKNDLQDYVVKPISGRLGENVAIFNKGKVVEGVEGRFGNKGKIYQELFKLPLFDNVRAILGGWVVGESGSGIIIREHLKLITENSSPVICCRVVN